MVPTDLISGSQTLTNFTHFSHFWIHQMKDNAHIILERVKFSLIHQS